MGTRPFVIIVGGIGGNQLWIPGPDRSLRLPVWLSWSRINDHGLSDLRLASDGVNNFNGGQANMVPSLVLAEYYSRISDYLAGSGFIPVSFVQDWRPQIADVVGDLVKQITDLSADQRVHLVGHSNGGLVIREALNLMTPADRAARVGRVVGLGVPHYGSWAAPQMLSGINQLLAQLSWFIGRGSIFNVLSGVSYSVNQVVGSWPTAYEMLPSPNAPGITQPQLDVIYGAFKFRAQSWVLGKWIDAALARWGSALPVPADVAWLHVLGTGQQTPYRLSSALLDPTDPNSYDVTPNGDGAVPVSWAVSGSGPTVTTAADHVAMTADRNVHSAVRTWLNGATP